MENHTKAGNLPTAEEFCKTFKPTGKNWMENFHQTLVEFAKLHVQACKEEIKKEAKIVDNGKWDSDSSRWHPSHAIDKESIDNAYPLTNIK